MAKIFRGPAINTPNARISLGRFLFDRIKPHGDQVAIICEITGKEITFTELLNQSLRLAAVFQKFGLTEENSVGIISENNWENYVVVLATLFIGASIAPINPTYIERELEHCLVISKPCLVIGSPLVIARVAPVVKQMVANGELSKDTKTLLLGTGPSAVPDVQTTQELASQTSSIDGLPVDISDPEDKVSFIMCSSGTTGLPKGVELTNKNVIAAIKSMCDPRLVIISHKDTISGLLPTFHMYGLTMGLISFTHGSRFVIFPKFNPEGFLSAIQKYKISMLMLVPPILVFLGKHPLVAKYDLSSVREIWCGAAPLSKEMQESVTSRLGMDVVRQGYGLTETTFAVTINPLKSNVFGSSGTLIPGISCKVLNVETGNTVGVGEKGELCFYGELIMKGYRGNSDATKGTVDEDGWLHTGDIGYIDEDGYIFIVDRLKELIKYKGFQVAPAELEALLLTHPGVQDAAVIGVPDEKAGELPRAFIVRQQGCQISEKEIAEYVADKISPSKRLYGGVRFVNKIPKTASGKILRRELREQQLRG